MTTPRLLGSRYEIGETLGYGGMAEVHRGRDVRLGREVAVKVLRADLARDPSFQARFRREAQAAASLNHPAIVAVYDTGEEDVYGNQPYIVMEYVEGRTLRDVLKIEGRLMPRRAMEIVADVCAALDFSHRNGIVHRDVKPGNVMITRDRRGQGDGLRHRPRGRRQRGHRDPDRGRDRHRAVPVAGAGPRRDRRRPLGRLLHRRAAVRADHRAPAVHRRLPGGRRVPARAGEPAAAVHDQPGRAAGAGRDRAQGDGEEPGQPLPVRRRDAGRPDPGDQRPAGRGRAGDDRRRGHDRARRRRVRGSTRRPPTAAPGSPAARRPGRPRRTAARGSGSASSPPRCS